jgi:hypothetical protein
MQAESILENLTGQLSFPNSLSIEENELKHYVKPEMLQLLTKARK